MCTQINLFMNHSWFVLSLTHFASGAPLDCSLFISPSSYQQRAAPFNIKVFLSFLVLLFRKRFQFILGFSSFPCSRALCFSLFNMRFEEFFYYYWLSKGFHGLGILKLFVFRHLWLTRSMYHGKNLDFGCTF
jgi:hypothetical protein